MTAEEYFGQGNAYAGMGKYDKAVESYRKAIALKPDADAYYNLGNAYEKQNKYVQAIEAFQTAIELKPDFAEAYNNLGNAYGKQNKYVQAIEAYQKAIELKPDYATAYYNLGNIYGNLGEYDNAIEAFQTAIELKPDFAEAYNNLGNAYGKQNKYVQAIEAYQKAIELKPDEAVAYNNLGITYANLGEHNNAIEAFQTAIELKPDEAKAYNNLGVAYANRSEYDKAIEAYRKAIELKPDEAEAYNNLGNTYKIQGEYDKSIEPYKNAKGLKLKNDPYFSDTLDEHGIEINDEDEKYAFCKEIYVCSTVIMQLLHVGNREETARGFAHYTCRDIAEKLLIKEEKDISRESMLISILTAGDPAKEAKTFLTEPQKEKSVSLFRINSVLTSNDPTEGEIIFKYFGWKNEEEEDRNYQAFIACFTFDPESLNQFRLYGKEQGKEATGVSLVFEKEFFAEDFVSIASSTIRGAKDREDMAPDTKEKYALYRCIYIDPETKQIVALGHKDDYTFYRDRDRQDRTEDKRSDEDIKGVIEEYNKKINGNLQAVRDEFKKLKALIEENEKGKDVVSKRLIRDLLINLRYLVKHIAFKEEQECRIVKVESLVSDKVKTEGSNMFIDTKAVDVKQVYFAPYATDMELFQDKIVHTDSKIKCRKCTHPIRIARA